MSNPVTLFTGQWGDFALAELLPKVAGWGYDGLELSCKGDHFDYVRAAGDTDYCAGHRELLAKHGLDVWAIGNHRCGQLVCDPNDFRTDVFVPERFRGKPAAKRDYGIEHMKLTAQAARNLGVQVVTGFTGSAIWSYLYRFPAVDGSVMEAGFAEFAELWNPILDVFGECGVRFALEVHPAQIAYDFYTTERALDAVGRRPEFGINFDPSHLYWQMLDPVLFIREFGDRIYHMHVKDCAVTLDGRSSILGSHFNFGEVRRGWDFRSAGHGQVPFGDIFGALNAVGYTGPLSVEWEDSRMDREWGAADALRYVRRTAFPAAGLSLDQALGNKK
jgi:sugar phosphate isomerase/epimerase